MPLNNNQITAREGMITPFVNQKTRTLDGVAVPSFGLGSMGYDIRLKPGSVVEVVEAYSKPDKVSPHRYETRMYLDPTNQDSIFMHEPIEPNKLGHIVLFPDRLYLASTVEEFNIPQDVLGLVFGKSTYARLGLIPFMTPLEPGWKGFLTLEFSVIRPLRLIEGAGIAQVVFFQGEETTAPYTGKYQYQAAEAVGAMVGHDEIVVKWDLVSPKCNWVAMDEDCRWFQYTHAPIVDTYYWLTGQGDDEVCYPLQDTTVTLPPSFDWTQTLRRRPQ